MPIYNAWIELSTSRPSNGMGLSPIPFSALDRYAERYGLGDLDDFELFRRAIRAMDSIYLPWKPPTEGGT